VTQHRRVDAATRQHGRPQPSALGQARVADGIHAAVNVMQSSAPDPQLDRALAHVGGP
jgi:hypothetical protein